MSERISSSLRRLFDQHRIVFWYDADRDLRHEFDDADVPGVTKVEVANNEFGLKYRMLRQEAGSKFLVYHHGPKPVDQTNWLLDILLSTTEFHADQATLWLTDLGLPLKFEPVVRDHMEFYRAKVRVEALKAKMSEADTATQLRLRMLAVCVGAGGGLDTVIEALLGELADESEESLRLLSRCNLDAFFWKQVGSAYGYAAENPSLEDFALTLFDAAYRLAFCDAAALRSEALVLFSRWKNDRRGSAAFEKLSAKWQDVLEIPKDVLQRDLVSLDGIDFFEEIDRHLIRATVRALAAETLPPSEALSLIRQRRQSHWYERYADIYQAIEYAVQFQQALAEANLGMTSPTEAIQRYTTSWFRLDQLYRKFVFHMQRSNQPSILGDLFRTVENHYGSSFLLPLNNAWQDQVAKLKDWSVLGVPRQLDFYREQAAEFRRKDQKVVVIISDALRFEVAEQALTEIRKVDRFEAELSPMIGVLPSFTQLGMAALLPNKALHLSADDGYTAMDAGQKIVGTAGREKQLETGRVGDKVKAMTAEEVLAMKVDEGKELFREHDVIYIYHNRIDVIGDEARSEERVPEAAEDAVVELVTLVRKLTSANFSNILVTADHGFLYQHRPLEESDYSSVKPVGQNILVKNRRFVVGSGLEETAGFRKFSERQLGLDGELEVLIPNSIGRLRYPGGGNRFVHGGATLQEIVVPLLRVGKKREADTRKVGVQIIATGKNLITSGQIAVTFYQSEPVSAKVHGRQLVAGIYAEDGKLLSDEHVVDFDFSSDNPRDREIPRKFLLSRDADAYNNQSVLLKLRERQGNTRFLHDYASQRFQLRRGISADFDF
ncbi:MAG: BREX-1 system phosphatase PglZ type A [Devosia sp.]|uniref:BREX-1 system phosphatase PglZ type A n=1 Tax=Devosia sp. TaxID=1871048 RepID=UPI001A3E0AF0|nr:BREX-1 system phosphatase PglZ type A [Devosia sp.]MBL8596417.1 BREX-1 system phosphatase PglZ type A [Devosia sp.]